MRILEYRYVSKQLCNDQKSIIDVRSVGLKTCLIKKRDCHQLSGLLVEPPEFSSIKLRIRISFLFQRFGIGNKNYRVDSIFWTI